MWMTKVRRNAVYQVVVENGLDPKDCNFSSFQDGAEITYKLSGEWPSEFTFYLADDNTFEVSHSVGGETPTEWGGRSWEAVLENDIPAWVEDIRRDNEIPDLWSNALHGENFFTSNRYDDLGNMPFNVQEQAQIGKQLQEIKDYIKATCSLSNEQVTKIESTFKEAEEASRRIGRKDWILLFYGAVFSLIITNLLSPQAAEHIFMMALHGIGHLFGFGAPPQLPPTT